MADLLIAVVTLIAGLVIGFTVPQSWLIMLLAVAFLMYLGILLEGRASVRFMAGLETVTAYALVAMTSTIVGSVLGGIARQPVVLLYAFWLYLLVSSGFMVSRYCLGWHVGASAAVLTAFVGIGLLLQSLMAGGFAWVALLLVASGLWWGADSWRRANGLAIFE